MSHAGHIPCCQRPAPRGHALAQRLQVRLRGVADAGEALPGVQIHLRALHRDVAVSCELQRVIAEYSPQNTYCQLGKCLAREYGLA